MHTALSIAGSDPTGGAGIQADLQVFHSLGVHGAAVVTTLTVQDSHRIHQNLPVFPSVVLDQLRVLIRDVTPDAVKIGVLATDDVVRNVILGVHELGDDVPIVLDPVLASSDGTRLLERRAWATLAPLIERATLVTPNVHEAEQLAGGEASSRKGAEECARVFLGEFGARALLLKGGHREGSPDDLLAWRDGDDFNLEWLPGERVEGDAFHGTGCALSAAIAAELAKGATLVDAVSSARAFVVRALRASHAPGSGARFLGFV